MNRLSNGRSVRPTRSVHKVPWDTSASRYFGSGREAVVGLIRQLELEGTSVLLPAYAPEGLFAPFSISGCKINFYPQSVYAEPDWQQLEELLERHKPSIAALIHTYGILQDGSRFRSLCDDANTLMLEDTAHLLSFSESTITSGDVVLKSLPKMSGLPDGGVLVNRRLPIQISEPPRDHPAHLAYTLSNLAIDLSEQLAHHFPAKMQHYATRIGHRALRPYQQLTSYFQRPAPMSSVSRYLARHVDWRRDIAQTIKLQQSYRTHLPNGLLFPDPHSLRCNIAMFAFPILVEGRSGLIQHLQRNNIDPITLENRWDFFRSDPQAARFREVDRLTQSHLLLPTSPRLSEEDAIRIARCVADWDEQSRQGT